MIENSLFTRKAVALNTLIATLALFKKLDLRLCVYDYVIFYSLLNPQVPLF